MTDEKEDRDTLQDQLMDDEGVQMKLVVVSGGKKTKAMIDGDTAIVADTLRGLANTIEHGDSKAIGVGVAIAFVGGEIATIFEEGSNPAQLVGACDELKFRIRKTMRGKSNAD